MPARNGQRTEAAVDALLAALDHPRIAEIHTLRALIRGVDPRITESVKWNAPSFATTEHFATFHLRAKKGVMVVLHLGARPASGASPRASIDDPTGMLEWRGDDRATATFADQADIAARRDAFAAVIRQWLALVP